MAGYRRGGVSATGERRRGIRRLLLPRGEGSSSSSPPQPPLQVEEWRRKGFASAALRGLGYTSAAASQAYAPGAGAAAASAVRSSADWHGRRRRRGKERGGGGGGGGGGHLVGGGIGADVWCAPGIPFAAEASSVDCVVARHQMVGRGRGGDTERPHREEEDREEVRELNKTCKRDHTAVGPTEESSPKKVKASLSLPAAGVAENASISIEYANSGRSTCKGCSESIAAGALRLGASIRDPRGFDSTKWYHIACFPASTYPAFPVENLKGFDSIENQDHDKLRELEENCKRDGNATDQLNELNLKKEVVHSMEDSKGAGNNLEGVKMLAGDKRAGPVISFSVSDIKKNYKDATLPAHWKVFNTVIFHEQDDGLQSSAKIAAFDFDGCLAKTSVRIVGADKWSLLYESIPEKLQILYNDGYKLVIFTNESNIERWNKKRQQAVDSKIGRLDKFIERVKVPIQVFIACGLGKGKTFPDDPFRKPNTGMWWLMTEHFNSGVAVDMDKSFYVGDAAGRENDHSDADKEFAKAIGLKFHVPEEYFGEAANIY